MSETRETREARISRDSRESRESRLSSDSRISRDSRLSSDSRISRTSSDSSLGFLGEIPAGWEIAKVRQYFRLRSTKVSEKDYPPLSVAKIGVVPQLSDVAISMAQGETRKLVLKGDFVVNSRSDRKGSCGIAPRDGSVTTISIVLEPHDIEGAFVHYLFRSVPWVEEFYRNGRGIVADLWTTNYQQMRNMLFPLPPLSTQRAIVSYLDGKCGKIDALVAAKTKMAALLKELRQRLIADAVTGKGEAGRSRDSREARDSRESREASDSRFSSDSRISRTSRDSSLGFLGEIPAGWEIAKVRQYFRLRSTKVSEKDYPPLSVAKIGVVPQLSDVAISMAQGETRKLVLKGDFVVNSRSDRKGSCGIAPRDGSVTTISIVLEPHDIEGAFVHYLFRSVPWVEEFYRNGRGIVADLWTTNYQQMRNMLFPLPPLSTQRAIVAYLDAKCAKIDAAIRGTEKEIEHLKEYRQRLIADVVTGQKRVN